MSNKWEVTEDGYFKRSRYVECPSGEIIGYISSVYADKSEWRPSIGGFQEPYVGPYVTEDLARKAVEQAVANQSKCKDK
jgi:hypothetical protein